VDRNVQKKKMLMKKTVDIQHSIASNRRAKDVKKLVLEGSWSWFSIATLSVSIHGFL